MADKYFLFTTNISKKNPFDVFDKENCYQLDAIIVKACNVVSALRRYRHELYMKHKIFIGPDSLDHPLPVKRMCENAQEGVLLFWGFKFVRNELGNRHREGISLMTTIAHINFLSHEEIEQDMNLWYARMDGNNKQ